MQKIKLKEVDIVEVEHISERIVNISELETIIENACIDIQIIQKELKKADPPISEIDRLAERLKARLFNAKSFEFVVEQRKAITHTDN